MAWLSPVSPHANSPSRPALPSLVHHHHERAKRDRRNRRPRLAGLPSEQPSGGAAADAALARPHAAASLQLGASPAFVPAQRAIGHVFTSADDCVIRRQRRHFTSLARSRARAPVRSGASCPRWPEARACHRMLPGRREAGDTPFYHRGIQAANPRTLAGAVDRRNARLLPCVRPHRGT